MTLLKNNADLHTPIAETHAPTWAQTCAGLKQRVRQVLTAKNGHRVREEQIVRVAIPVVDVAPLVWLQQQRADHKIYWSDRTHRWSVAAIGEADVCTGDTAESLARLRQRLSQRLNTAAAKTRYYGGLRFDREQAPSALWQRFGGFRFVLPRFELLQHPEATELVCNLVLPRDYEALPELLQTIDTLASAAAPAAEAFPLPLDRTNVPGVDLWRKNIEWALEAFEKSALQKVVFAREATFTLEDALPPVALLERLAAATPGCFHFLFQPDADAAFLGATPERLFRQRGRVIESEAVAGTRPRGASAAEDARLHDDLFRSKKDHREHEFVRLSVRERLETLCDALDIEETPSEMKLARRRHLVSNVTGTLCRDVTSFDVLEALHPTPAVGGYPQDQALATLRKKEPFDRGWYAGPVGWLGRDAAEFAVGIRSGLIHGNRLSLYSGAGIVRGSEPLTEWEEVENKISDFLEVLGLALQPAD